jgi:ABC-type branched-subunit amino acid transport system permease subunit
MFTALMSIALVCIVVLSRVNYGHAMEAMRAESEAAR